MLAGWILGSHAWPRNSCGWSSRILGQLRDISGDGWGMGARESDIWQRVMSFSSSSERERKGWKPQHRFNYPSVLEAAGSDEGQRRGGRVLL
jgi:hypothetical protein